MLPDEDGLTILRKLRDSAQTARLPVIMLTAKGTEYDKVIGLDSGADRLHSQALWNDGTGIPGAGSASESGAGEKGGTSSGWPHCGRAAKHTVKVQ